jgi:hypothetical protein
MNAPQTTNWYSQALDDRPKAWTPPTWTVPPAAKPPTKRHWLRWTLAGVIGLFVLIGVISAAAGGGKSKGPAVSASKAAAAPAKKPVAAPKKTSAPAARARKPVTPAPKPVTPTPKPVTHAAAPAPKAPVAATSAAPPAPVTPPTPTRHLTGTATTLGAGTFTGGTDVAPGLYNVTTTPGQSGNFIVNGTDEYNEILGANGIDGVPMVRAQISTGDSIQISGLSQVIFTPVSTPLVTTQSPVTLGAGTWTVGQDVGPGRYVATPGAGQSGNFIIDAEDVNEILGGSAADGGVPSVTFNVQSGDVITVSGLSQVTLTPAS